MKSAVFLLVLAQLALLVINVFSEAEWVCEPGVLYKENECNECNCTTSHKLACGDKGCLDPIESILFNCKEGTVTQKDCNRCECVKDWGTVCTNNPC